MFRMMLIMIALIMGGCASVPSDLQTPNEESLLPFSATHTIKPSGQPVRWGGEIASVSNLEHGSLLEVVEFSLNATGRPVKSDNSGGRFRMLVPDFIDPAIYAAGRQVSAVGQFSSVHAGKVGEHAYAFPLMSTDQVYLWPEIKEPSVQPCHNDPFFFHRGFMLSPIIVVPAR